MNRVRPTLEQAILRGLCWFSSNRAVMPLDQDLYRTKIFSGLLRGMYFSMPRLERAAFALGTYERHIVNTIARYVQPGAVAYDIGANSGYLSLVMAKRAGTRGQVFAFEPDPLNLKALEANIQNNLCSNLTPVPKAVSDHSGTVTFAGFDYSLVGHIAHADTPDDARLFQVQSTRLDDFVFVEQHPKPNFIKIDVEGAEEHVFRGAVRVLEEAQPVILAEIRGGETWQAIVALMQTYNYTVELLSGGWQMEKDGLGDVLFIPAGVAHRSLQP